MSPWSAVSVKAKQCCVLAWPAGARKHYSKDCDSKLAVLWLILVQPLLFGAIGIEIDFREIQGSLIWKTVIILALGQSCTAVSTETTCLTPGIEMTAVLSCHTGFSWLDFVWIVFARMAVSPFASLGSATCHGLCKNGLFPFCIM